MDKYIKNAAIYLAVKNEKEDNYFISNKIEKLKQCCKRDDIEINNIFINYHNGQENVFKRYWNDFKDKIKKENIEVLILENNERIPIIDNIEIENVVI